MQICDIKTIELMLTLLNKIIIIFIKDEVKGHLRCSCFSVVISNKHQVLQLCCAGGRSCQIGGFYAQLNFLQAYRG